MSTSIGSDPGRFEMSVIIGISLLFGFMLYVCGTEKFFNEPKRYQEAPCSTFASYPLNEIPARCVTTDGGFKK